MFRRWGLFSFFLCSFLKRKERWATRESPGKKSVNHPPPLFLYMYFFTFSDIQYSILFLLHGLCGTMYDVQHRERGPIKKLSNWALVKSEPWHNEL